jgi:hypothetical protein
LVLASLTFACKKKNEDPTIFEGKVVYADDGTPAAGMTLAIKYNLKSPPLTGVVPGDSKEILIGEDGQFKAEFGYNSDIRDFAILAWLPKSGSIPPIFTQGDGLECLSQGCSNLKPHQNYSNLLIKVTRP